MLSMDAKTLGDATLHGWREKVGDAVARRAPVSDDVIRAALGIFWFAAAGLYVIQSARSFRRAFSGR